MTSPDKRVAIITGASAGIGKASAIALLEESLEDEERSAVLAANQLASLGWRPEIEWEAGMRATVGWFAEHLDWLEASHARGKAFFEQWYRNR